MWVGRIQSVEVLNRTKKPSKNFFCMPAFGLEHLFFPGLGFKLNQLPLPGSESADFRTRMSTIGSPGSRLTDRRPWDCSASTITWINYTHTHTRFYFSGEPRLTHYHWLGKEGGERKFPQVQVTEWKEARRLEQMNKKVQEKVVLKGEEGSPRNEDCEVDQVISRQSVDSECDPPRRQIGCLWSCESQKHNFRKGKSCMDESRKGWSKMATAFVQVEDTGVCACVMAVQGTLIGKLCSFERRLTFPVT